MLLSLLLWHKCADTYTHTVYTLHQLSGAELPWQRGLKRFPSRSAMAGIQRGDIYKEGQSNEVAQGSSKTQDKRGTI